MENDKLDQTLQLVVSRRFLERVDQWRRRQTEIPLRSEAIRVLVQKGVEADEVEN